MDNTDISLEIEKIKRQLFNDDKNMEIVFHYLDKLAEKKETAPAQVERKRIGYVPKNLNSWQFEIRDHQF